MCSATSSLSYLFLSKKPHSPLHPTSLPIFNPHNHITPTISRRHISSAIAQPNVGLSWVSPNEDSSDDIGGWAVAECPTPPRNKRGNLVILLWKFSFGEKLLTLLVFAVFPLVGIGTSLVVLAAVIAGLSLSRKG